MTANLVTDVDGVRVGSADDAHLASGVTVVLFDEPAIASIAINGGAPALRDTALLEPEMTVERVDGLSCSLRRLGLRARRGGRGDGLSRRNRARLCTPGGGAGANHVPGASLFDLLNGGDKAWGGKPALLGIGLHGGVNRPGSVSRSGLPVP